jgi:predicted murein hydrolase (TIGR00659 family)
MPKENLTDIWVYLSASPLTGLTITLMAYSFAHRLYLKSDSNPLLHPVLVSATLLISFLLITDTSYQDYFKGSQYIHFILGPATVALAIPMYQQISKIKKLWLPITVTMVSGVSVAAMSSIFISRFLGASLETQMSLAPKSVTAPVAMGISEQIGGLPSLTAALVVITGILGAILGTKILHGLKLKDHSIKGIAMGITAHGIGTARAFQVSSEMGAFSGLAMALATFTTAFILPYLVKWLGF